MAQHHNALVPIESWCYHSPEIRFHGGTIDIGLFAEALVYYDEIYINPSNQPQFADFVRWFVRQNKQMDLISLIEDGTIRVYEYSFLTAAILKDGVYSIWNMDDPESQKPNSFEQRYLYHKSFESVFPNSRQRTKFYRVLRDKVIEVKADTFGQAVDNARSDYHDRHRSEIMLQSFVDEIFPLIGWKRPPKIEVNIQNNGEKTTFIYNVNFEEISRRLGKELNFHLGTPLTAIAHCNRLLWSSALMNCDLFLGSPMSTLVGDKLQETQERALRITNILDMLNSEVEFPDLRQLVNDGKIGLTEILQIRKKAKKFRDWLQSEADHDRNAIIAYHNEVAREPGFVVKGRKTLKLFGILGGAAIEALIISKYPGLEGALGGTATGAGFDFLLDLASKIGADWRPIVFGNWLHKEIHDIY